MEQVLSGVLAKVLNFRKDLLPQLDLDFKEKARYRENVPFSEYCADRSRMNASALKSILETPAHFLAGWNKGSAEIDAEEDEAKHLKIGRAAHLMLLEPALFRQHYVVEPVFTGYTKAGKPTTSANAEDVINKKKEWISSLKPGALILNEKDLTNLIGMVESIFANKVASAMLKDGIAECVLEWTDRVTGVRCKGRPDFLTIVKSTGEIHLIDFKTTKSLKKGLFTRDCDKYMYHVSMAMYADAILEIFGRLPSTITLFAVESVAPYASRVLVMDDSWYEDGQQMYRDGLELYRQCFESGKWPAYANNAEVLERPSYLRTYTQKEYIFYSTILIGRTKWNKLRKNKMRRQKIRPRNQNKQQ